MGRKVQAQRKFAQGAYMPPLHQTNHIVERRADMVGGKDDQRSSTTYNSISANSLLDLVSFANIHTHQRLQPVVRLERLKTNEHTITELLQRRSSPIEGLLIPRRIKRLNKPKQIKSKAEKWPVNGNTTVRKSKAKRVQAKEKIKVPRRKRRRHTDSKDQDEDNTPLKFLATSSKNKQGAGGKRRKSGAAEPSRKQTRKTPAAKTLHRRKKQYTGHKPITRNAAKLSKMKSSGNNNEASPVLSCKKIIKRPGKKKPEFNSLSLTSKSPANSPLNIKPENINITGLTANCTDWEEFARLNSHIPVDVTADVTADVTTDVTADSTADLLSMEHPSLHEEYIIKDSSSKLGSIIEQSIQSIKTIEIPTTSTENGSVLVEANICTPVSPCRSSQSGYYGASEIQQWINNSMQNVDDDIFKIPAVPDPISDFSIDETKNEIDDSSYMSPLVYCDSECPSMRYFTVKDIMNRPIINLGTRCNSCVYCNRVDKMQQSSQQPPSTDVNNFTPSYEFEPIDLVNEDDDTQQKPYPDDFLQSCLASEQQEAPRNESPRNDSPSYESPRNESPSYESPRSESPSNESPSNELPSNELPSNESPNNESPSNELPCNESPKIESPSNELPCNESPKIESPSNELPCNESPKIESPSNELPCNESPKIESPSNELPCNESPSSELPSNELPCNELPCNESPCNESPSNESTSNESPCNESPNNESPCNESPCNESPNNESPSNELPCNELPCNESPSNESPCNESPNNESPCNESPNNESPNNESPNNESPNNESPNNESPSNASPSNASPSNKSPSNASPSNESPTEELPTNESSKIKEKFFFLDLFPGISNDIIKFVSTESPLEETRNIMRALLISKALISRKDKDRLVEHKTLLSQLLATLNMKLQRKTGRTPVPFPETSPDETSACEGGKEDEEGSPDSVPSTSLTKNKKKRYIRKKNSNSQPSTSKMATRATKAKLTKNEKTFEDKALPKKSNAQTSKKKKSNIQNNEKLGELMDAPVYYPNEEEFKDPLAYITKIMPTASKFGICKVVAPKNFQPPCSVKNEIRFNVSNQYLARLYKRWGPITKEICAIKTYLISQSVLFNKGPLVANLEVSLPKLYHVVQKHGGLKTVMEKKRWGRVADDLRNGRTCNPEKLDILYLRYLLPYDTLSNKERQEIMESVEKSWEKRNAKMLERATNPLHRQKRLLGESDSSGEETEDEGSMSSTLAEAEDCMVSGRSMTLATFAKAAAAAQEAYYGRSQEPPQPADVENKYWRFVVMRNEHVCVYSASLDTGDEGYGFPTDSSDPYGTHPWNLKVISQNEGNVLRSLGPVLGVTVPTLHFSMMFSTSCWHRDPHGLPWIEYMHRGPPKIWYGIPDEQSDNFRRAVETLCPTSCQNKSIWLPSDITMIPPKLLREHKVTLSRLEQAPGEYVIVFPKAYSSSISTGYTQSESVYFATDTWLSGVDRVFLELRDSCEPTMFSIEQLLLAIATDERIPPRVLRPVSGALGRIIADELAYRRQLARLGLSAAASTADGTRTWRRRPAGAWNVREQDECEVCRATLYLSKVTGMAGRRAAACLQHAVLLLRRDPEGATDATLHCHYTDDDLRDAVCALDARLRLPSVK